MTDEIISPVAPVEAPVAAPVEQKSPELATTEPKTPLAELEPASEAAPEVKETAVEAPKPVEDSKKPENDLVREKFEAQQENERLRRQLEALKPPEKPLGEQPKIEDYQTIEEFVKDTLEYGKRLGLDAASQQTRQAESDRQAAATRAAVAVKEAQSRAKYADFDSVVAPLAPVIGTIPVLKQFIGESDMGTEVAYHLAKNPILLDELSRMTPFAAGRQLLSMEAKLKAPPVAQSSAPAPITPVGSRESLRPTLADLASKDINGYMAKRNKEELSRMRSH